jgi:hypothetical protein
VPDQDSSWKLTDWDCSELSRKAFLNNLLQKFKQNTQICQLWIPLRKIFGEPINTNAQNITEGLQVGGTFTLSSQQFREGASEYLNETFGH